MCKGLSNILKRILSVVIICIIMLSCIFSPYFSVKVFAEPVKNQDDTHTYYASDFDLWFIDENDYWQYFNEHVTILDGSPFMNEKVLNYIMTQLGISSDDRELVTDFISNFLKDTPHSLTYDTKGNLIMSADTLLQLRNLVEQYIKTKEPYTIYYPGSSKVYYEHYSARFPTDGTSYVAFRKYFDTFGAFGQPNSSWDLFDAIDFTKFRYAYIDRGYISFVDKELNSTLPVLVFGIGGRWLNNCKLTEYSLSSLQETLGANNVVWSSGYGVVTADTANSIYKCNRAGYNGVFCGQPIPVFNSLNDLYDYVNSKPIAYYTSDYYNKTYQDITLNQETINKYTNENVQNIYNTINNNVTNAVNADELQQIIDSTLSAELDKISGSLDDVNKGLDGVNDNLQDIKEILNQILSTNEEFFQNDMEYLKTLLDALQNSGIVKVNENGDTVFDFSSIEVNINFDELFDFLLEWNIENGTGTTGGGLTDEEKNEIFFYIELYYEKLYALSDDLSGYFENVNELLTGIRNLIANQKDHDYGFYEASFTYFSKSLGFDKDIITELQDIKKVFTDSFDTISEYLTDSSAFFEDIKKLLEEMKKLLEKMNTKLALLVGTDVADLILDLFGEEEISDQLSKISSQLTALETMKTKFPLSIPWDIANVMVLLESEPVAPKFKMDIPIDFNILGYNVGYDFVLDVDLEDYEKFSELLRSFLALTFMVYLYRLTIQFKNK